MNLLNFGHRAAESMILKFCAKNDPWEPEKNLKHAQRKVEEYWQTRLQA